MIVRPMPRLALDRIMLKMPDFSLQVPESFKANRPEIKGSPQNLVQELADRLPWQPPFTVLHPALENLRDYYKLLLAESPGVFLQTDGIFHRKSHDHALKKDILQRWWARWLHEKRVALTFSEEEIYKEILRLEERFAKSKAIAQERTRRQFLERIKVLERFAKSRDIRWEIQKEWAETRVGLIKQGFLEAERIWDWRQANLFTLSDTGHVARLPFQGRPLENVLGELHHKKVLANLEEIHVWRFDTKYTTLPNGGMTQIKSGGGQTKEHVDDLIKRPLKEERTEGFRVWHQSRFRIESPNHVPIAAPMLQGHAPELIGAEIQKTTIDQRVEGHRDFHQSGRFISLPNQSMTKAPESGEPIELVTAEAYWPKRTQATALAQNWGESLKFTPMTNGSFGRLAKVGDSKEKVVGDLGEKVNLRQENYFDNKFLQSDYGMTPNGGYLPLMHSGDKIEVVSGDQATKLAQQRSRNHLLWLWTGKHIAPTANGSGSLDQLDLTPGVFMEQKEHQEVLNRVLVNKDHVQKTNHESVKESFSADQMARGAASKPQKDIEKSPPQKPPHLPITDESSKIEQSNPAKPKIVDDPPKPALKDKALKAFQTSLERDGTALAGRLQGHVGGMAQTLAQSTVRPQGLEDQQIQKTDGETLKNKIS